MATGLSSNWKNLQDKIKAENAAATSNKRKAAEEVGDGPRPAAAAGRRDAQAAYKKQKIGHVTKDSQRGGAHRPPASFSSGTKAAATTAGRTSHSSAVKTEARAGGSRPSMGVAQSSKVTQATPHTVSPSLALWAADNDISPEDIAEAYGLGIRNTALLTASGTKPNAGLSDEAVEQLGKYVALDCEMVGVGPGGHESVLARASVVDFHGRQVYDSFVRPRERVTDWRTAVSGVGPKNMATARDFDEVQAQIANLLHGRILVGHDIKKDLAVLMLKHPPAAVRDTSQFSGFKKYGHGPKPALRVLAREILGVEIQDGQHSSIEDARTAMLLFRRYKPQFDSENMTRFPQPAPQPAKKGPAKHKKTKKKRRN